MVGEDIYAQTYSYFYNLAEQYGTSVEVALAGAGAAIFLYWVFLLLAVVKIRHRRLRIRERVGAEVVSKASVEGRGVTVEKRDLEKGAMSFPADKVNIEMKGNMITIKILESESAKAVEEEPAAPEIVKELEEPKDMASAVRDIEKKYSLKSVTVVNEDGMLIESTSDNPEDDATIAAASASEVAKGSEVNRIVVEGNYLFSVPRGDAYLMFLIRPSKKLESEELEEMGKELSDAASLF